MTTYIKVTRNTGHTFTGPFANEAAAREYWGQHQTSNVQTQFIDQSEVPSVFGKKSIGTLKGTGLSANAMNFLIEVG